MSCYSSVAVRLCSPRLEDSLFADIVARVQSVVKDMHSIGVDWCLTVESIIPVSGVEHYVEEVIHLAVESAFHIAVALVVIHLFEFEFAFEDDVIVIADNNLKWQDRSVSPRQNDRIYLSVEVHQLQVMWCQRKLYTF